MKRGGFIKRKTHIKPVSPKKKTRMGKLGIERVAGKDVETRRMRIGNRDGWICEECLIQCTPDGSDHRPRGEWAHRRNKRNHGDGMENGRILCGSIMGRVGCHQKEHNCGGKPIQVRKKDIDAKHDERA